jgi:hypothetical protein
LDYLKEKQKRRGEDQENAKKDHHVTLSGSLSPSL